jgi:hypothetical protein
MVPHCTNRAQHKLVCRWYYFFRQMYLANSYFLKCYVVWDLTPYTPLKIKRLFGGICRLHVQGRTISQGRNQHETGLATFLDHKSGFEVAMSVAVKATPFLYVTPCSLVEFYRFIRRTCCYLQSRWVSRGTHQAKQTKARAKLHRLIFDPEDGCSTFLRNTRELVPE